VLAPSNTYDRLQRFELIGIQPLKVERKKGKKEGEKSDEKRRKERMNSYNNKKETYPFLYALNKVQPTTIPRK
jgi:hypothetical protein